MGLLANLLAGAAVVVGGAGVSKGSRLGYESAPYTVVREEGNYEIRQYPTLHVVETQMNQSDSGFQKLFGYISGSNDQNMKIAMTTPVYNIPHGDDTFMAFVMPSDMSDSDVPMPTNSDVNKDTIEEGQFAVLRYSGRSNQSMEDDKEQSLRDWLAEQEEQAVEDLEPTFAYFDPPWVPGYFRRNEVMFRLSEN